MDMTVKTVAEAVNGTILCGREDEIITSVCTDSRSVAAGSLFVPLIGERQDAHAYIGKAFDAGANAALTSEHDMPEADYADRVWIKVEDTKKALQDIGSFARSLINIPLIGVTGSVGKTTTREMIAAVLSAEYRTFKTPENHNSQVGLPITLTEISSDDEIGVIELGISLPGEMEKIARIARLSSAVITNITDAHIEALGCRENIMKEKLRIQDGFLKGGILFLNGDDELLKNVRAEKGFETIYYGTGKNCSYRAVDITLRDGFASFTADCAGKKIPVRLGIAGIHNVINAMAAMAVADVYGVDLYKAAGKLSEFHGYKNRMIISENGGVTYINDTYNANPASMKAALSVLVSKENSGRKIAVLGDMMELGEKSISFHEDIGEWICEHRIDILFTYGGLSKAVEKTAREGNGADLFFHFDEGEQAALTDELKKLIKPGDCVLLKGSNSMKLSEVAAALIPEQT